MNFTVGDQVACGDCSEFFRSYNGFAASSTKEGLLAVLVRTFLGLCHRLTNFKMSLVPIMARSAPQSRPVSLRYRSLRYLPVSLISSWKVDGPSSAFYLSMSDQAQVVES